MGSQLLYWSKANNKVSSAIPNSCGVFQGAVLSLFFSTLHTSGLFSEPLASFLKYADDVVIDHRCRDPQSISIINKYVPEWSVENGLNLNPTKCVQCMCFLRDNAVIDSDLKATKTAKHYLRFVPYLGVTFSSYAK